MLREELELTLDDSVFSTDNTSVLKYIFSNTSRHQIYMANRSDPSQNFQWRYASSANNPAYDASWGMRIGLLAMMEDGWEGQNIWKVLLLTSLNSLKNHFTSQTLTQRSVTPVTQLIEYFSSWEKLQRAAALLLKCKNIYIYIFKYIFVLESKMERSRSNLFTTSQSTRVDQGPHD